MGVLQNVGKDHVETLSNEKLAVPLVVCQGGGQELHDSIVVGPVIFKARFESLLLTDQLLQFFKPAWETTVVEGPQHT